MIRRSAVIAYHSSPLAMPGAGDAGGMTVYVRNLASELTALGIGTDIFTRSRDGREHVVDIVPNVRAVALPAGPSGDLPKAALPAFVDEFADRVLSFAQGHGHGYDVVHSHYWQSGLAGAAVADHLDLPLVHSPHTLGLVKNRHLAAGDPAEPVRRLMGERVVIRRADLLTASTTREARDLTEGYGAAPERVALVHPGVDHRLFWPRHREGARQALGLGDASLLLYVGRIQRLKGLDLAIRAVEELAPALDADLVLGIVGGASGAQGEREVRRLKDLARSLGVGRRVRFFGPQPHDRLPYFYSAADAVVVTSHYESFGLSALEAHACATPVVGTAVGGLSFVVGDGRSGFLVEDRDPSVFAARLKTLLSDRDLTRSFGDEAVRTAARFSWGLTARRMADLYGDVVARRGPRACVC